VLIAVGRLIDARNGVYFRQLFVGWANKRVIGPQAGANGFMFFGVNVDLTEEGIGMFKLLVQSFEMASVCTSFLFSSLILWNKDEITLSSDAFCDKSMNEYNCVTA
jgi:hypothetical protein